MPVRCVAPVLSGTASLGEVGDQATAFEVEPTGVYGQGQPGAIALDEPVVISLIGRFDDTIELRGTDG